jgi:hypothetical protein
MGRDREGCVAIQIYIGQVLRVRAELDADVTPGEVVGVGAAAGPVSSQGVLAGLAARLAARASAGGGVGRVDRDDRLLASQVAVEETVGSAHNSYLRTKAAMSDASQHRTPPWPTYSTIHGHSARIMSGSMPISRSSTSLT